MAKTAPMAETAHLGDPPTPKKDQPMYPYRALHTLSTILRKAEGSRGGHIIGHTKSGKPIYEHGPSHQSLFHQQKDYSAQDHLDAEAVHDKAIKTDDPANRARHAASADNHRIMATHIKDVQGGKNKQYLSYHQGEAKKWSAGQTEGHQKMANFHKLKAHYIERGD